MDSYLLDRPALGGPCLCYSVFDGIACKLLQDLFDACDRPEAVNMPVLFDQAFCKRCMECSISLVRNTCCVFRRDPNCLLFLQLFRPLNACKFLRGILAARRCHARAPGKRVLRTWLPGNTCNTCSKPSSIAARVECRELRIDAKAGWGRWSEETHLCSRWLAVLPRTSALVLSTMAGHGPDADPSAGRRRCCLVATCTRFTCHGSAASLSPVAKSA